MEKHCKLLRELLNLDPAELNADAAWIAQQRKVFASYAPQGADSTERCKPYADSIQEERVVLPYEKASPQK